MDGRALRSERVWPAVDRQGGGPGMLLWSLVVVFFGEGGGGYRDYGVHRVCVGLRRVHRAYRASEGLESRQVYRVRRA